MKILYCREILQRQADLASSAYAVDVASYNVHVASARDALWCTRTRLVVGMPEVEGERQSTMTSIAQQVASRMRNVKVAILLGSHVKLFVATSQKGKVVSIIGSQNLGEGHPYEMAVELDGHQGKQFQAQFNKLWTLASPVKVLDFRRIAQDLSSSKFEV